MRSESAFSTSTTKTRADLLLERLTSPVAALAAMIGVYVALFGDLVWRQQSNFGTFGFDMGIFDQEIWLASHFKNTFITVRGLNMWANHVNPIVYLLAPAYWLGAGPHFLYVLQTVALAAGAIPLWLLARDRFGDGWLALCIPAAWLLYPSIEWMTWWHFHPESLAVTPFLFAWWLAGRGQWRWYALCVVAVLFTKEDAAVAILALGVVVALKHNRRAGLITAGAALAWLVLCLKVIIPDATGMSNPFYTSQFSELGSNLQQIVFNMFRHPSRVLGTAFRHDRHDYYVKMLAPVAGVALLAPVALLLAVPTAMENVLNNQGYPHNYQFQYQCFVAAGIFIAVVEAIAKRRHVATRRFLLGAVMACVLAANVVWSPSPLSAKTYHSGIWAIRGTAHTTAMDQAVHLVPAGASVSASYDLVPHLAHRTVIYEWPNPWVRNNYGPTDTSPMPSPNRVQYLVIDTGLNPEQAPLLSQLTGPNGQFQVLFNADGAEVARRL
jgi:uncharacterized membrane protein